MKKEISIQLFPQRWLPQAALVAAAVALTGCTVTPCTDTWQPYRPAAPATSPGVLEGYYRVNPGDTLAGIAGAYGQRVQDVAAWNHIAPNGAVMPGQILRVAPPAAATSIAPAPAPAPGSAVPLSLPATGVVATPFSAGKSRGIVIAASGSDRTVRAAATGRVVYAGTGVKAYGPLVILKHENGLITAYGHNEKLLVNEGDAVRTGQPVAEMGTDASGRASFEFEVRQNGKAVDPMGFLPKNCC